MGRHAKEEDPQQSANTSEGEGVPPGVLGYHIGKRYQVETDAEVYYWCSSCGTRHGRTISTIIPEYNLHICPDCKPRFKGLIAQASKTPKDIPGQRLGGE